LLWCGCRARRCAQVHCAAPWLCLIFRACGPAVRASERASGVTGKLLLEFIFEVKMNDCTVVMSVCLSVCLSVRLWPDVRNYTVRQIYFVKFGTVLYKIWYSSLQNWLLEIR
jgi:hypothetical protein